MAAGQDRRRQDCNHRGTQEHSGSVELLNVSYDPTRELWRDINENFIRKYANETGNSITIQNLGTLQLERTA